MLAVVLAAALVLVGCGQKKYVAKPDEERYGTWINDAMPPQRIVNAQGTWKEYLKSSDDRAYVEGTEEITGKWTDSAGNIWYKTLGTITGGTSGYHDLTVVKLEKLSKSATVLESVWSMPTSDAEVKNPVYPAKIDPSSQFYGIHYRTGN